MKSDYKPLCVACGTEYYDKQTADDDCPICQDDRQYIPQGGQQWTSHEKLLKTHSVQIKQAGENLFELTIIPSFAIGQRAFLILSKNGNILWDCIPLLDPGVRAFIESKGGLKLIAISHPHYYSNMLTWTSTFNCPVMVHVEDAVWAPDTPEVLLVTETEKQLWDEITFINTGGHFPGSAVLHVPATAGEGATLFCGDSLYISRGQKHISIMYSYPNHIPLPLSEIQRIKTLIEHYSFDKMYGAFSYQNLTQNVPEIWQRSMRINLMQ